MRALVPFMKTELFISLRPYLWIPPQWGLGFNIRISGGCLQFVTRIKAIL